MVSTDIDDRQSGGSFSVSSAQFVKMKMIAMATMTPNAMKGMALTILSCVEGFACIMTCRQSIY